MSNIAASIRLSTVLSVAWADWPHRAVRAGISRKTGQAKIETSGAFGERAFL